MDQLEIPGDGLSYVLSRETIEMLFLSHLAGRTVLGQATPLDGSSATRTKCDYRALGPHVVNRRAREQVEIRLIQICRSEDDPVRSFGVWHSAHPVVTNNWLPRALGLLEL